MAEAAGAGASVDVAIVGGGLVGACLAGALQARDWSVALIERAPPPASEPAWDERSIALNLASREIFRTLGLWSRIETDAEPIRATHISERGRFGVARFAAADHGLDALGFNLPVRAIGQAAWQAAEAADGVQLMVPESVEALRVDESAVSLGLQSGRSLAARLLVAADGAGSAIRDLHGIGARRDDYRQTAVIAAARFERHHQQVAYERFTPDGPIAVLPKPDGACAIVWTVSPEQAEDQLTWSDGKYRLQLHAAFGHRLGRPQSVGRRWAFPLQRVMADALTAPRTVFVGNAAQTLHPVAAQGFNLGLRDVITLAEQLEPGGDPGDAALLARYAQARGDDRDAVSGFTDQLVRVFSNRVPGLRGLRHLGLLALDLTPPAKRHVMARNLGLLARPSAATP